jgi:hypothetical protein
MTPALLIARGLIIHWITLWLAPVEYAFDRSSPNSGGGEWTCKKPDGPSYTTR